MSVEGYLRVLFTVYYALIFVRILLSFFPVPQGGPFYYFYKFIYDVTEPYLRLFRRFIPPIMFGGGGIDLSPIVAILVLSYVLEPLTIWFVSLLFAL